MRGSAASRFGNSCLDVNLCQAGLASVVRALKSSCDGSGWPRHSRGLSDSCFVGVLGLDRKTHAYGFDLCHESHQNRISHRTVRLRGGCRVCAIIERRSRVAARWFECRCARRRKRCERLGRASRCAARPNDRTRLAAADRQRLLAQWNRDIRQRRGTLHEVGC